MADNNGLLMSSFFYKNNELYCDGVSLAKLAKEVGTPCFVYSESDLKKNCQEFKQAFDEVKIKTHLRYAVKASSNLAILQAIFREGYGADVVSQGEIMRSLKAELEAKNIVFSGVGKTANEIKYALDVGIGLFNVESFAELKKLL
ncbi:diaminopimelate decarboxylase family protein [Piscirickettsia litoralis]|uniref:diaminopimelate decarboxylase family protein n=1 Tax=Piscirickettsia litoralis TaxID=1891921 RepID=UPI0009810D67|nr:hypothetical protein [Piscirickettsia litoralis]